MSGISTTRKRSFEFKAKDRSVYTNGEGRIAESFGVGLFTVSDIYRSRRQLTDFVSHMDTSNSCSSRKSMKKATKLGIDNIVASSGCLTNFKSRHGIRELEIPG
ncbi:hypothetical protein T07_14689 [Trichinella nelsoni]|uniref:Jerky protein n=1 Tax=Trichinella nelsoni TaxID=6336 RepID=A0A0V0RNA6_9BILA|nr:hypothetical protein T07_14689 [Trichinella nelsoni]